MRNYISGRDLLTQMDILPFELFNYVKEGHQPLDQFGRPIPPPDISAKLERLKKLREELRGVKFMPRELSAPILEKIKTVEKDLDSIENKDSWAAYELPDDKDSAQWVIDLLQNALFEREQDTEKDEGKHSLYSEAPIHDIDKKQAISVADYIVERRAAGVKDDTIAYELHDEKGDFKKSYLDVARALGLDGGLQKNQIDALKQRGKRACERGRENMNVTVSR